MFARSATLVLTALTAVTAWPIFFYENTECNHYPVFTLEGPSAPGKCGSFGRANVRSYSGGTRDNVEKLLLYYEESICFKDAAHRAYANHTINNSTNLCVPFQSPSEIPRAYVFVQEILGPIPTPKAPANASACSAEKLVVQN